METTPRRFSLTIRRDADYDGLMALLALQPAELPGETVSRIYEIRYIPEKEAAVPEDLQILVIGDEVYCLRRAADGSEKSYLAGCSADAEEMWQIGVDVLPEYRGKGIASAITSHLAEEIIERNKVPFYCSAWSNIRSVRNAIKSGFTPAWAEMTIKPSCIVDEMNSDR